MISIGLALIGLFLLILRLWPRGGPEARAAEPWPKVSLIIPARNEEHHLPRLLTSLLALDYPDLEIIVVDDRSEDATSAVTRSFAVRLIEGAPKPDGWFGKPWACHQGSLAATGTLLLFTDADTVHRPKSLRTAVASLRAADAQGLTALPYHQNPKCWERLLGPFQLLLLALTNPYGKARKGRVFAIGQYLLFDRTFYDAMGGHASIKAEAVDDIALAERTLGNAGRWSVYHGRENLFDVRMYETFGEFIRGWRRNFRGGLRHNSPLSSLEVLLFFMAMTIGLQGCWPEAIINASSLLLCGYAQQRIGRFSWAGILLLPFSIATFTLVTLLALFDRLTGQPLAWKNRTYP